MLYRIIVLTIAAAVGPILAAPPKLEFEKFTSDKGGFTVEMPGSPQKKVTKTRFGELTTYRVSATKQAFAALYIDSDEPARGMEQDALKAFRDGWRRNKKIKMDREIQLGEDKLPGREYRVELSDTVFVRERLYQVGKRIYILYVISGDENLLGDRDADRFFDSFTLKKGQPGGANPAAPKPNDDNDYIPTGPFDLFPLKRDVQAEDVRKLQGTWRITSGTIDKKALTDEQGASGTVVIDGNKLKVLHRKGKIAAFPIAQGEWKIDPRGNPKTIDLIPAPDLLAATSEGIYALDGDKLKICFFHEFLARGRPETFEPAVGHAVLFLSRQTQDATVANEKVAVGNVPEKARKAAGEVVAGTEWKSALKQTKGTNSTAMWYQLRGTRVLTPARERVTAEGDVEVTPAVVEVVQVRVLPDGEVIDVATETSLRQLPGPAQTALKRELGPLAPTLVSGVRRGRTKEIVGYRVEVEVPDLATREKLTITFAVSIDGKKVERESVERSQR